MKDGKQSLLSRRSLRQVDDGAQGDSFLLLRFVLHANARQKGFDQALFFPEVSITGSMGDPHQIFTYTVKSDIFVHPSFSTAF